MRSARKATYRSGLTIPGDASTWIASPFYRYKSHRGCNLLAPTPNAFAPVVRQRNESSSAPGKELFIEPFARYGFEFKRPMETEGFPYGSEKGRSHPAQSRMTPQRR